MSLTPHILSSLNTTEEELARRLIRDVQEVFSTMVGMEDLLHLPIQVDLQTHFSDCITSMVGFAGTYNGLICIHVPKELAMGFASGMLGMEITEVDDDVHDALGEIANMIAGSFKQHLSKGGSDVHLSTPSVVSGSEYVFSSGSAEGSLTLRFATDDSWFLVSISLESDS